ncbi:hypothetical protein FRX31_003677 [Thalictrum thalictroides]|uniref:Uncharacterized protein n=1 Tax=Thalictrum thalictroides TaxID=46969 RepID=A0A7J6XB72_THATH|nr:hypothetical protein FRX31_003677 [Thalictrum thalictroides]
MLEITEEDDEDGSWSMKTEAQKERIRQIIKYQKTMYLSSSSSFSSAASSSSSKSSSLLELMKGGSTSLRRLFDMEHTSLGNHFKDYSGSPIIKPILLWGSDTDDDDDGIQRSTSWKVVRQRSSRKNDSGSDDLSVFASNGSFVDQNESSSFSNMRSRKKIGRLIRTKSYKRLPGINLWKCNGFKFRLRLKRLRIMICGKRV